MSTIANDANNMMNLDEEPEPCDVDWSQIAGFTNREGHFQTSTDGIDGISGVSEKEQYNLYGASFMTAEDLHTPYYDRLITVRSNKPWFGQSMEQTYMNNTKKLNEDPVQTYKQLQLSSIDPNTHVTVEHFDIGNEQTQNWVFKVLFGLFLVMFIYYLLKQIK